jgi:hypothetical protein
MGSPRLFLFYRVGRSRACRAFLPRNGSFWILRCGRMRSVMHHCGSNCPIRNHSPTAILSEVAAEGMTNFIEGQKVLLDLGKQQNEILMTA